MSRHVSKYLNAERRDAVGASCLFWLLLSFSSDWESGNREIRPDAKTMNYGDNSFLLQNMCVASASDCEWRTAKHATLIVDDYC